jgi:hypothetical protein
VSNNVEELVRDYIQAVGERRFDRLEALVHPDATFSGTVGATLHGAGDFVAGFRRLGPIIERNDIRELLVDGDRAFVLYDFVTDTEVGPVLSGELVTIEDGKIRSTILLFDWRRWPEVVGELRRRAEAQATAGAA